MDLFDQHGHLIISAKVFHKDHKYLHLEMHEKEVTKVVSLLPHPLDERMNFPSISEQFQGKITPWFIIVKKNVKSYNSNI